MKLLILLAGLLAVGCQTKPKVIVQQVNVPYYPPAIGAHLSSSDVRRVRTEDSVHTYYAGRSVDKNGNMHEAHRIYRLRQPSAWDFRPMTQPLASSGPTGALRDYTYSPMSNDKRVRAEIQRQKEGADEIAQQAANVRSAAFTLQSKMAAARDNKAMLVKTLSVLGEERKKREAAEAELARLKASQSSTSSTTVVIPIQPTPEEQLKAFEQREKDKANEPPAATSPPR